MLLPLVQPGFSLCRLKVLCAGHHLWLNLHLMGTKCRGQEIICFPVKPIVVVMVVVVTRSVKEKNKIKMASEAF